MNVETRILFEFLSVREEHTIWRVNATNVLKEVSLKI
jgi:hypothetical protein